MDEFKHYEFETDPELAGEIVRKIRNILQSLFTHSTVQAEFTAVRRKAANKADGKVKT